MTRQFTIFVLFTSAMFLSYFFRSANAVIAPDLSAEMGLDAAQLGLMTSLFFGAFAAMQIPLGIGLDRWGPRWVTPGLMLAAVVGALVYANAGSFGVLALGRALIGMGMAGVLMGSLTIFSQWFSARRYATVSGLLVGLGSLGALAAATPLAWLNHTLGWRAVFVAGAIATACCAAAIMLWARNTPPGVPWRGGQGSRGGLRVIFADLRFWRIAPLTFFLAGMVLGFQALWAGPYLFDVLGLSPIDGGNVLLLLGIGTTLGYSMSGWLADRFGIARMTVVAGALFAASQLALAAQPPLIWVTLLYLIFGFTGGYNVMMMAQTRRLFPLNMTGQAVTAANLFAIGGTFLLQWWMGLIIGAFPATAGHYPPIAYSTALLLTAVGTLATLLWYAPLAREQQDQVAKQDDALVKSS
jgi:predicted MFS family arabinose efflux permease